MLNNKALLQEAERVASVLHDYTEKATRGKKTHATLVKNVLESTNRKKFIENITFILEGESENKELLNSVVTSLMSMPLGNVPLFLSLIRFKYAYVSSP